MGITALNHLVQRSKTSSLSIQMLGVAHHSSQVAMSLQPSPGQSSMQRSTGCGTPTVKSTQIQFRVSPSQSSVTRTETPVSSPFMARLSEADMKLKT